MSVKTGGLSSGGLWECIFGFINVGHAFSVTDNCHADGCAITRNLQQRPPGVYRQMGCENVYLDLLT